MNNPGECRWSCGQGRPCLTGPTSTPSPLPGVDDLSAIDAIQGLAPLATSFRPYGTAFIRSERTACRRALGLMERSRQAIISSAA